MGLFPSRYFSIITDKEELYFNFTPHGYNTWDYNIRNGGKSELGESIQSVLNTRQKLGMYAELSEAELIFKMFAIQVKINEFDLG